MKKGSAIVYLEVDHDHVNYPVLLDLSGEIGFTEEDQLEVELEVTYNYHYDKGRRYGAPENCYPPEFEFEVDDVYLNNKKVTGLLTDDDFDKLEAEAILTLEL